MKITRFDETDMIARLAIYLEMKSPVRLRVLTVSVQQSNISIHYNNQRLV